VAHVHAAGLVHGSVSPSAVLMADTWTPLLSRFHHAVLPPGQLRPTLSPIDSDLTFAAPEVVSGLKEANSARPKVRNYHLPVSGCQTMS
jgi:hypothetical protein